MSYAFRRVHDLLAARILRLNLDAGRTEVICVPAGKGAAQVKRQVRKASVPICVFLLDIAQCPLFEWLISITDKSAVLDPCA